MEAGARPYELTAELETVGPCDFDGTLPGGYAAHTKLDGRTGDLIDSGGELVSPDRVAEALRAVAGVTSARVWALALIPALALAALMFLVTLSPSSFGVTATIGVTAPSGAETAATITQAVDSFRSSLTTSARIRFRYE